MRCRSAVSILAALALSCLQATYAPAAFSASVVRAQAETAEQHIEKARVAIEQKRYGEAKKELKRALSLDKESGRAYLLLARVHRLEGKRDDAIRYVKRAIAFKPGDVEVETLYARLLFEARKFEEARQELALALISGAGYPAAYMLKGDMDLREANFEAAAESYEKAISLAAPDDPGVPPIRETVEALRVYISIKARQKDDPDNTRPVALNRPMPRYTEDARRARTQGIVVLAILVSEKGEVTDHKVLGRLAYGLTEEAVKAVRKMRFKPAMKTGQPAPYWMLIEVEFNLR